MPTDAAVVTTRTSAACQHMVHRPKRWSSADTTLCIERMPTNVQKSASADMFANIAHIRMADGSNFTLTLTGYKTHQNLPASTFTYDKSMVPAGTQVVDLR